MASVKSTVLAVFLHHVLCSTHLVTNGALPVVLWHGALDTSIKEKTLGKVRNLIEAAIPGVYVYSIALGNTEFEDFLLSAMKGCSDQVATVCETLRQNPVLRNGYNAIGFSQGGVFFRAIVERCPGPQINNLITFGSAHQGVYNLSDILNFNPIEADFYRNLLFGYGYTPLLQERFSIAGMYHDPYHEDVYKTNNTFLPDINNEVTINEEYVSNLIKITKLVLVRFEHEELLDPPETAWFGFYAPNSTEVIIPLKASRLYTEDRLGLRYMDENGQLEMLTAPGRHSEFIGAWMNTNIIDKYLR